MNDEVNPFFPLVRLIDLVEDRIYLLAHPDRVPNPLALRVAVGQLVLDFLV
ncbi:hypothetical protein [Haloferax gibbonsii]|uniref:hypothetical protein n=1 Tax=Haloferax gibbonsii TaxID=35746 RepID=UPI0012E207AF|nr:hypothetical protein [Haloferax gibbonsii]